MNSGGGAKRGAPGGPDEWLGREGLGREGRTGRGGRPLLVTGVGMEATRGTLLGEGWRDSKKEVEEDVENIEAGVRGGGTGPAAGGPPPMKGKRLDPLFLLTLLSTNLESCPPPPSHCQEPQRRKEPQKRSQPG